MLLFCKFQSELSFPGAAAFINITGGSFSFGSHAYGAPPVTRSKGKTLILDKFHNHSNRAIIGRSLSNSQLRRRCQTTFHFITKTKKVLSFYNKKRIFQINFSHLILGK